MSAILLFLLLCLLPIFISAWRKAAVLAVWGIGAMLAIPMVIGFWALLAAIAVILASNGASHVDPTVWTPTVLVFIVAGAIIASYHRRGTPTDAKSCVPKGAKTKEVRRAPEPAPAEGRPPREPSTPPAVREAISALRNLGFSKGDTASAVAGAFSRLPPDVDAATLIRAALRRAA